MQVSPVSSASTETQIEQAAGGTQTNMATKETFLQLLVAQIRNQDPLNPADGVEFLSQLTQFSQLEQLLEIRSELQQIRAGAAPSVETGAATESPQLPAAA